MPYRSSPARKEIVPKLAVKAWLEMTSPDILIFVDGSVEKIDLPKDKRILHIHVPYEGNFNLSFMRNVGMRKAIDLGYPYIQIMDSDIFPTSDKYFENCISLTNKADMLRPFVANSLHSIVDFESINDKVYSDFINLDMSIVKTKRFSYSTTFQKAEICKKLHGYDEKFQLWGAEDDDYLARVKQAKFKVLGLPNSLLVHSWHEPDTAIKAKKQTKHYQKNYDRWKQTLAGKLPIVRMPNDWGLHSKPRVGE